MQTTFPTLEIHSDKIITEQNNLICSGGATSWQDLTSYLIKKFTNAERAREINNFFLLNSHEDGQAPFTDLLNISFSNDLIIQKTCIWIKNNLNSPDLLRTSVQLSALTERTYKRRFKKATGLSPIEYIQNIRIEYAKKTARKHKKRISKPFLRKSTIPMAVIFAVYSNVKPE
jgi:Transcriptional regulator containing an amidase domain and an AraC-type DNA-binding HTH domain